VDKEETDLSYGVIREHMCDFIGYEVKDRLRMKIPIDEEALEEELELEQLEEQPITITQ
jgi:hypothetical protein